MPPTAGVDWSGIEFKPFCVICGNSQRYAHLRFDGQQYATEHEVMVAMLLTKMGFAFTPNVRCPFLTPPRVANRRIDYIVPDFIFNGDVYVWTNADGTEELIHGIEVKGISAKRGRFSSKARRKLDELRKQRGISIKLLSNQDAVAWLKRGRLPLRPYVG